MSIQLSKEFYIAVASAGVELILYFAAKYLAPSIAADVEFIVKVTAPIILVLIGTFAARDISAAHLGLKARELDIRARELAAGSGSKRSEIPF